MQFNGCNPYSESFCWLYRNETCHIFKTNLRINLFRYLNSKLWRESPLLITSETIPIVFLDFTCNMLLTQEFPLSSVLKR